MVLEATVVCVDNSEWMRNGDYAPTRVDAQNDAVNLLCSVKLEQNPENTVGVMTMAGKSTPEVLVTPTQDMGKILTSLHNVRIGGNNNFKAAIQIAQLCLKHRQNKHQKQRVIAFIGSPIDCEIGELEQMGKKLKKNNVAVDVVNFGEEQENTEKLERFIAAVNAQDNSRLITVPPGPHILCDIILRSPLVSPEGMGMGGGMGADVVPGGGAGGFDFDPNLDPELAMALRISMEEERARLAEAEKASGGGGAVTGGPATTGVDEMYDDEDAMLQQAMAMSMESAAQAAKEKSEEEKKKEDVDMSEAMADDDETMQMALQMSMQGASASAPAPAAAEAAPTADAEFLRGVLAGLPGVDPSDDRVRAALDALGGEKKEEEKKDESK